MYNARSIVFLGFFLFGLFFIFDYAYGISVNFDIEVSLDKDQYEIGEQIIVQVVDTNKNISSSTKDSVTVEILTRVSPYTVPVTIDTVQLLETGVNSGIFTGTSRPISDQDITHSSGVANKYISASYTPVYRGQIYSSAYADLITPPPLDSTSKYVSSDNPTDCPKSFGDYYLNYQNKITGLIDCYYVNNISGSEKTYDASLEVFSVSKGYPIGGTSGNLECTGKQGIDFISSSSYYLIVYWNAEWIPEVSDAAKQYFNQLESSNILEPCTSQIQESEPIPKLIPAPEPIPEPTPQPEPVPEPELEECLDYELIIRKKIETIAPGDTASFPIFVGHINPTCDVFQKYVTVALSLTADSQKLRQDGDWGFPTINKSITNIVPFDTTLNVYTLPTIPKGQYSLLVTAEDRDGNQKTVSVDVIVEKPKSDLGQKSGVATSLQGEVTVKRTSGDVEYLKPNSILYAGDRIFTLSSGHVEITFQSGHKVTLGPNSEFRLYDISKETSKFQLLKGKVHAFFENGCIFCIIETSKANIAVRGTEFLVTHVGDVTAVEIIEGTVDITNLVNRNTKILSAGDVASVDNFGIHIESLMDDKETQKEYPGEGYVGFDGPDGTYDGPGDVRTFDDGYEDEYDYDFYDYEDPPNLEYVLHDLSNYNVAIEIPDHWETWASIDKSEFPHRTFFSFWYNSWMNWLALGIHHDIGQQIDLQNYDQVTDFIEDYERKWCIDSQTTPIYLDDPGEEGWMTCLDISNFIFKKITVNGVDAIQVSYEISEKFRFDDEDEVEFEKWKRWLNLIPYDDDMILIGGETIRQNVRAQEPIILDSINSFQILDDSKPVFLETLSRQNTITPRPLSPIETLPLVESDIIDTEPSEPTHDSDSISIILEQNEMQLQWFEPIQLKVSGQIEDYSRGARILFTVTDPNGQTVEQKIVGTKDGNYENILWFDKRTIHGEYEIKIEYQGKETETMSFNLLPPYKQKSTELLQEKNLSRKQVPEWIKNNVQWWADGAIGDDSFKQGISFMIKEDIIAIDDLPESSDTSEDTIPYWVKNNAKWWAEGQIDETEFVNGLKYMVEKGLIGVN
ncbi:FecR domain-containing protein [Nitrosopumilus sp. b2]|uniref:FecR family protein n=1 Tax=Nitrosopumilus sp. b2 TaxID=2109908 RepID=UPI0015F6ECDA|nr:FecR domain-containing protein [Nitrosopumilus sp. b2]